MAVMKQSFVTGSTCHS